MTTIDFELEQPGAGLEQAAVLELKRHVRRFASPPAADARHPRCCPARARVERGEYRDGAKTLAQEAQGLLDAETTFAGTHPQCRQSRAASFAASSPRSRSGFWIGSYRGAKMASIDQERRRPHPSERPGLCTRGAPQERLSPRISLVREPWFPRPGSRDRLPVADHGSSFFPDGLLARAHVELELAEAAHIGPARPCRIRRSARASVLHPLRRRFGGWFPYTTRYPRLPV